MKRSDNPISIFCLFLFTGCIYIVLYYKTFNLRLEKYTFFSIGHIIIASLLLTFFFMSLFHQYRYQKFSIVSIMLWLVCIYYYIAAIKYPTCFFISFNEEPEFRIIGSIIIGISICIALLINWRGCNVTIKRVNICMRKGIIIFFIISLIYTNIINPRMIYDSSANYEKLSVLEEVLNNSLNMIMVVMTYSTLITNGHKCICFNTRGKYVKLPIGYIGMAFILLIFMLGMILTGRRTTFFIPATLIIALMLMDYKINVKLFMLISAILPIFYLATSIIVFMVSGRLGTTNDLYAAVLGYRCDFCDFANEIAANTTFFTRNAFELLIDGMKSGIPSMFGIDKSTVQRGYGGAYDVLMHRAGLTTTDYGSSVFFMGASIGGYIGIVFSLPILVIFYRYIEKTIINTTKYNLFYLGILAYYFVQIEILWTNFFPRILWCVISFVVGKGVLLILNKTSKCNRR